MVKRSKRSEIYQDIVNFLKTGSYNTLQISEKTNINWKTVKNALETLQAAAFVKKQGNEYSLSQPFNLNEDTYLGLPLTIAQEKEICEIANRIKEYEPSYNRTFLHKAVVEVIKRKKLFLPYGWYLYGECCVPKLLQDQLNKYGITKKYDSTIKQVIGEFKQFNSTNELMKFRYEEDNKELYSSRLNIDILLRGPFNEKSLRQLELEFKNLIWEFKEHRENEELLEYIEGFYSTFTMLLKLPVEEIEDLRIMIINAYRLVWDLIGSFNLYASTKKYFQEDTYGYYKLRAEMLKELADFYILKLQEYWPELKIDTELKRIADKHSKVSQDK